MSGAESTHALQYRQSSTDMYFMEVLTSLRERAETNEVLLRGAFRCFYTTFSNATENAD